MASTTGDRTAVILLSLLCRAVTGSDAGKGKGGREACFFLGTSGVGSRRKRVRLRWCPDTGGGVTRAQCTFFVNMEPHTLFIPQYADANLIIFVRSGHAKIGWIYKDRMGERRRRVGDVSVVPTGSAFYLINDYKQGAEPGF